MLWTILLVVVIVALFGGPLYGPGYAPYANLGYGGAALLLLVLIVLLARGV